MKTVRNFKVTTVEHGYALEIENKGWLLEDERQLAEAVVFRVALGCKSDVSKGRMRKLLNMLAYGPHRSIDSVMSHRSYGFNKESRRNRGKGRNFFPTQSRRGHRNYGPQEEVNY